MDRVIAVVVTYRRPRLAGDVVRRLIEREGFAPRDVVLVVNGDGGIDDPELESALDTVRLADNQGPAGGFRAGLRRAAARGAPWIYLCEDDVGLFDLPSPRVAQVVADVADVEATDPDRPVGAVVAYGRDLDPRTGLTLPHRLSSPTGLELVDVAAWGSTLVSRRVVDAGVLPDERLFFGYEDFDFFLRMRAAGFRVVVDAAAQTAAAGVVSGAGRDVAFADARPRDRDEPWRAYYVARNFLELRRRYGHARWSAMHLAKSAARLWRARSGAERRALLHGLADGFRHRLGRNERYLRTTGEH